jgi:hypothetical protein
MLHMINLQDKRLTELEAIALSKMLAKREQYVAQGRGREAHGAGTAIWILWSTLTEGRQFLTGFGDLNG